MLVLCSTQQSNFQLTSMLYSIKVNRYLFLAFMEESNCSQNAINGEYVFLDRETLIRVCK